MEADVRAALSAIPQLAAQDLDGLDALRLGGLTNRVYRIGDWCLRLPGEGTEAYIDREVEAVNARAAAAAGVAPEVVHADPKSGLMVTRFLTGTVTMTPELFRERDRSAAERAGAVFRRLHDSGQRFAFRFELFAMIDNYLKVLADLGAELPPGYHDVVGRGRCGAAGAGRREWPLAPCHCDPLCENFLDDRPADVAGRLGVFGHERPDVGPGRPLGRGRLRPGPGREPCSQDISAARPRLADRGRMVIYKAMCDLLWTLWGLIQHANRNPADDFWAYSINRFDRCKTLMATQEFGRHLAEVGRSGQPMGHIQARDKT